MERIQRPKRNVLLSDQSGRVRADPEDGFVEVNLASLINQQTASRFYGGDKGC